MIRIRRIMHLGAALFLIMLGMLGLSCSLEASTYTSTKITNNSYDDVDPQVNDIGQIVWSGGFPGQHDIYFYDGTKTTKITSNGLHNITPSLNNLGHIVWSAKGSNDDYEIYFYTGSATIKVTDNYTDDIFPRINNKDQIVWHGNDETTGYIYVYDNGSIKIVAHNCYYHEYQLNDNGQIVWSGFEGNYNIFLYDNGVTQYITRDSYENRHPQINDIGQIVWQRRLSTDDYNISLYDNGIITRITNSNYNNFDPLINNNGQIVWFGEETWPDSTIFSLANGILSRIATGVSWDYDWLRMNDKGQVVWQAFPGGTLTNGQQIFIYDGINVTQLTSAPGHGYYVWNPQLNNAGQIVCHEWDGFDWEIFLYSPQVHTINATAGAGGSISPSGDVQVAHNTSISFIIISNTDYFVADVLVDGQSVGKVTSYTFTNVTADHTIQVIFTFKPPPSTGPWSFTAPFKNSRQSHTATFLAGGQILLAGGFDGTIMLASAELYDPTAKTWTETGPLGTERTSHTATLLPSGKVLVAGGGNGTSTAAYSIASVEIYNPGEGNWTPTNPLHTARMGHTATLLPDGNVLVAGGNSMLVSGPNVVGTQSAEIYDPTTKTWTVTTPLNSGRSYHTATLLPNGHVLVVGGYTDDNVPLNSAEIYDPSKKTWTQTGVLGTARSFHTATLLPNGKVLVVGGGRPAGLSSTELYDPIQGTWSPAGSLMTGRNRHTATLLPGGKVLFTGGNGASTTVYLASAELYDAATNKVTGIASLNNARRFHTATLLPHGRVLVAGGRGDNGYLTSVEIYSGAITSGIPSIYQLLLN